MVLKNWIITCLKMYKISEKVIKLITETTKRWKVELIKRGKKIKGRNQERNLPERCAFTIIFVIAMMPFNYIFENAQKATN